METQQTTDHIVHVYFDGSFEFRWQGFKGKYGMGDKYKKYKSNDLLFELQYQMVDKRLDAPGYNRVAVPTNCEREAERVHHVKLTRFNTRAMQTTTTLRQQPRFLLVSVLFLACVLKCNASC